MTNSKDVILKLKEVREEKGLSYGDILDLMEKNGDFLSKSTISRVFAEGSEDNSFRYEETIRPIANALLDIENIEDDDNMDTKAMKSLLQYKDRRIKELEAELDKERLKYHERLEKEREQFDKERIARENSIEFLKEQVSYKDKRMDFLLEAVKDKDEKYNILLNTILTCPCRQAAIKAEQENL